MSEYLSWGVLSESPRAQQGTSPAGCAPLVPPMTNFRRVVIERKTKQKPTRPMGKMAQGDNTISDQEFGVNVACSNFL